MFRPGKIEYSENCRKLERALSYDTKYEREFHKRLSDRREKALLRSLLEMTGRHDRLLDVPCGAGRLSGIISAHAGQVFEVDYSREMLHLCRKNADSYRPLLLAASAFQLPFPNGAFDMVISIRLSHHIPDREGRLQHLSELFRTARSYVPFTFFAEESWKNRLRNLHRRLGGTKRAKYTLSVKEVEALGRKHGYAPVASKSISQLFSGHYFTLLKKN